MPLHSSCPQSTRAARAPYVCSKERGSAMREKGPSRAGLVGCGLQSERYSTAASASLRRDHQDCLEVLRIFREALGPTVSLDSPPLHVTQGRLGDRHVAMPS